MGRRARQGLVLVRLERAQQRLDRRRDHLRAVQDRVRTGRAGSRPILETLARRPPPSRGRPLGRGLHALLARLGVAAPPPRPTPPYSLSSLGPTPPATGGAP